MSAMAVKEGEQTRARIDPRHDPEGWVRNNERVTNEADVEGWLALYGEDVVFEAVTDGAYDRVVGRPAVSAVVTRLAALCRRHSLRVKKRFIAATNDVIVNAWSGGFEGRDRQFGLEVWTLHGDLVARHEQYTFMDVRPSASVTAKLRALFGGELAIKLELAAQRQRASDQP